ncbi:hypothetical protein BDN72DRAFT_850552 [Pluteus cervinus]|uniref:Uncharacterized protein n=1 Tax=Pluteus cervinus TaxID=181527 RepID=A0ACD3A3V2_9AGAR|nr:hypothetical protein BDN72DRAFT_850552 [Pluteus cervinus]
MTPVKEGQPRNPCVNREGPGLPIHRMAWSHLKSRFRPLSCQIDIGECLIGVFLVLTPMTSGFIELLPTQYQAYF